MRLAREQNQEDAAAWIEESFKSHAKKVGKDGEMEALIRAEIEQCGEEFSCIVRCEEDDDFGQDLYALMKGGCPGPAVVELILVCTSGFHFTITDCLREAGITDEALRDVKQSLPKTVQLIDVLNDPALPAPLEFLIRTLPKKLDQRRAKRAIAAAPDTLRLFAAMLEKHTDPMIETIAGNVFLFSLYLLLHHYHGGFETLSRLLRTMRLVRCTVSPDATLPQNVQATVISSGEKKGDRKDPFSKESLQQRLLRFCRDFPSERWNTHLSVTRYVSDAKCRESGKTLLELILQDQEEGCGPDGYVDHLTKKLKLSDKQKAEVVSIFYEEEDQEARVLTATLPRRIAESPFPAVYFSKDVDSKMREIGLRTAAKVRHVLNPEQQVTFDRMEEAGERALGRMERKASRSRNL